MFVRIDKSSSTPVSRQLADQLRAQCLAGGLQAGDQLDSVRKLAVELAINPNTVLRVYEKLTAEGLLERRHGKGTFVADRGTAAQMRDELAQFREEFAHLVRRGRMLGHTPAQLRALLNDAAKKPPTDSDGP